LKDVVKIIHHFVPLSRKSLLKKQIDKIICSAIFLLFPHGWFLGRAREIVFKREKIETQLSKLKPPQGHALKNDQEESSLIPLIQIIFGTK
jgi:hypothetical protein